MNLQDVTTAQELIALIGTQQTFYHTKNKDSKGNPQKWSRNGAIKTFKRDNTRIRMPLKYGMGYSRNDYGTVESVAEFKELLTLKP